MAKPEIEDVEFKFNPYRMDPSKDPKEVEEIKKIFADDTAQIIWVVIKRSHLTNQYFNKNVLAMAAHLKVKNYLLSAPLLDKLLKRFELVGWGEDDNGEKLLPYLDGTKTMRYVYAAGTELER